MKYKLVCSDLDGTFVDWNGNVPPENLAAIKALSEQGVLFAISTGRPLSAARLLADQMGIAPYIVCLCGAVVQEPERGELLRHECFPEEELAPLLAIAEEYGAHPISFNFKEGLITDSLEETYEIKVYRKLNRDRKPGTDETVVLDVDETRERFSGYSGQYCKALFWFDTPERCREVYRELVALGRYEVNGGMPTNIELTKKGITKWTGIEAIMRRYGIAPEEVVCIGDGKNDVDMIAHAGLGVAVANAQEGVREYADVVTDTNENAGVAKLIYACLRGEYD